MTNEEKLRILLDREARACGLLRKLEPTSVEFATCLDAFCRCMRARTEITMESIDAQLNRGEELKGITDFGVGDAPGAPGHSKPNDEDAADACDPAPETELPKPEAKEEEAATPATNEEPQPTLTKAEVLAQLTPISIKYGSLVADVMNDMGYAKLSGIPAERYGELLDKVEEAVRCRQ